MVRTALIVLTALVALVTGLDRADRPALVAISGPEVSVRLTPSETDCIVGGEAGCWSVAKKAAADCMYADLVAGELDSWTDVADCYVYGGWTGIVCAFDWFLGLF